jgi:GPH family glycoside/pentoside/hexuronide:cation symporter
MGGTQTVRRSPEHLGLGVKLGYGIGDFGFNLVLQATAVHLLFFFTDVYAISAAAAGGIFLASKIWDAVIDPGLGVLIDNTRTRWGGKRPYLLFGAVPLGIAVALLFLAPPLPPSWKIVYSAATFILFCTALSVVNIPYSALTATMTLDSRARSGLSAWRMSLALVGTLVAAGATRPLVALLPSELAGFRVVGAVYGLLAALITLVTFFSVRERVAEEREAGIGFRQYLKVLTGNPPFLFLTLGMFLFMIAIGMTASGVNYFFKYNLRAESSASLALLALLGTAVLFIPVFLLLANRTSKRLAFVLGMSTLAAVLAALYFVGERSVGLTIGLFVVGGIGMSSIYLCPWAMLPDTVEYSQWKLGIRREGILYGTYFFFNQFGSAVAGYLLGMGLHLAGYVANAEQSARSLAGIRLLMSLVPLFFIVAGIVLIGFYSITAERHRQMVQEIYGGDKQSG